MRLGSLVVGVTEGIVTTAIISRIVNMIYFGDGYAQADGYLPEEDAVWLQAYIDGKEPEDVERLREILAIAPIRPWNILAITFTNKAAGEMRDRVNSLVEYGADSVWVSTFHSTCVRILRRHIEYLGYTTNFSIYDSDDQKTLMKQVFKANRSIDVKFSDFHIMRHPTVKGIYGVSLRQKYRSNIYADDGYLFLLWDFRDETAPKIHVRTWQPRMQADHTPLPENEIFNINNFNLQ